MPFASEEIISHLENFLPTFPAITTLLEDGNSIEDILNMIFADYNLVIHEKIYPEFYCNCSQEKTKKALLSISPDELQQIFEEDGGANVHCHFCNTDYFFTPSDI